MWGRRVSTPPEIAFTDIRPGDTVEAHLTFGAVTSVRTWTIKNVDHTVNHRFIGTIQATTHLDFQRQQVPHGSKFYLLSRDGKETSSNDY